MGFILSWLVLTGDQQGRINLFYLLLIYLLIPLLSITASLTSLLFGKGVNLARLITAIPIWSAKTNTLLRKANQLHLDKFWFLMQSQVAAIAFSLASLLMFFVLLLATDLNFVWRSTILQPTDILPLLKAVAWPWHFWTEAQPSLSLLEMTQDSRMTGINNVLTGYGGWWKFILATQLFYSFLLRILLMFGTRWWLTKLIQSDLEQSLLAQISQHLPLKDKTYEIAPIINHLPDSLMIKNWDSIPSEILELLDECDPSEKNLLSNERVFSGYKDQQLVIVKAWEGPLGELEDLLQHGKGYLLPLDWNDSGLVSLQSHHLQEWQRLIHKFPDWQLYVPKDFLPQ